MSPELKNRIAQLIAIRRKVDKATKRATEVYELAQKELWRIANDNRPVTECRHVLGMSPSSFLHPSYFILRGDFSVCYPDSVGPNTQTPERPQTVALSAKDAHILATFGPMDAMFVDEDDRPDFETSPLSMDTEEVDQC